MLLAKGMMPLHFKRNETVPERSFRHFRLVLATTCILCMLLQLCWDNGLIETHTTSPTYVIKKRYLTSDTGRYRRIGNHMFTYASLLGIADRNAMMPILPADFPLRHVFRTPMGHGDQSTMGLYVTHREIGRRCCTYDKRTQRLPHFINIKLYGFYQSWKYFAHTKDTLREHFTFHSEIYDVARTVLSRILLQSQYTEMTDVTLVGVHVRRGDISYNQKLIDWGYSTPNVTYYEQAMTYFRQLHRHVVFVVCSDDTAWARQHLLAADVFFSEQTEAVDLAVLSMCDDVIISVGSYGWWAGWLNNGTVIYYKDWPTPDSWLAAKVNKNDYFPPSWIGM